MLPATYQAVTDLLQTHAPQEGDLLELGAVASTARRLMASHPELRYHGIDLRVDQEAADLGVIEGTAHQLPFDDDTFDAVVSSSMFEHDDAFWLSLAEVRRVLRPGGVLVVGVPGYASNLTGRARVARRIRDRLVRTPALARMAARPALNGMISTPTYPFHTDRDLYRFSELAVREVLCRDLDVVEVRHVLTPPRIFAAATRP